MLLTFKNGLLRFGDSAQITKNIHLFVQEFIGPGTITKKSKFSIEMILIPDI